MATTRNTVQRDLVLQAVRAMHDHPTAEQVYTRIAQQHPSISRATVYRNLSLLAQRGDIRRVSHLNAADRFDFELRPHHHFRCTGCGRVFDAPLPYDDALLGQLQPAPGFVYEACTITFTGLCPHCAAAQKGPTFEHS
ncbi:MAG: Fur family transcriptional regulator [Oscillospiraceae bacterium]